MARTDVGLGRRARDKGAATATADDSNFTLNPSLHNNPSDIHRGSVVERACDWCDKSCLTDTVVRQYTSPRATRPPPLHPSDRNFRGVKIYIYITTSLQVVTLAVRDYGGKEKGNIARA